MEPASEMPFFKTILDDGQSKKKKKEEDWMSQSYAIVEALQF